jgi:cytochrome c
MTFKTDRGIPMRIHTLLGLLMVLAVNPVIAEKVDDRAAQRLLKVSKCTNCHSVTKEKDGPPYKQVAEKYKDEPDAVAKLYEHITTAPTVEVKGKEETHEQVKSDDPEEIKNLVHWILSR